MSEPAAISVSAGLSLACLAGTQFGASGKSSQSEDKSAGKGVMLPGAAGTCPTASVASAIIVSPFGTIVRALLLARSHREPREQRLNKDHSCNRCNACRHRNSACGGVVGPDRARHHRFRRALRSAAFPPLRPWSAWLKLRLATLPILAIAIAAVIATISASGVGGMEELAVGYLALFSSDPWCISGSWLLGRAVGLRSGQAKLDRLQAASSWSASFRPWPASRYRHCTVQFARAAAPIPQPPTPRRWRHRRTGRRRHRLTLPTARKYERSTAPGT